jgi:hypothetical protein
MNYTKGKWELIFTHYKNNPKKICIGVGVNETLKTGIYTTFVCNSILPRSDKEYIKQRDNIESDMRLIAAAPDMYEALKSVNNYFIDLQNKCALTSPDERAWKLISKILSELK